MGRFKRLATKEDELVIIKEPLTQDEIALRAEDYDKIPSDKFNTKHRVLLAIEKYKPVSFEFNGVTHTIQLNHCTNPFCRWYGEDQQELKKIAITGRKHYRYRLSGSPENEQDRRILCNEDPNTPGAVGGCKTRLISTWSAVEEIKRLVTINSVVDLEPTYVFHKDECSDYGVTPFENPKCFYNYGTSKTNSDRYKCKQCGKLTNVLPRKEQAFSYHSTTQ